MKSLWPSAPPSPRRNRIVTVIASALVAALVCAMLVLAFSANDSKIEASLAAVVILLAFAIGISSSWVGHKKFTARTSGDVVKLLVIGAGISLIGAVFGAVIAFLLKRRGDGISWDNATAFAASAAPSVILGGVAIGLVYSVITIVIVLARNREQEIRNARLEAEAREARLARELSEARLRLMQAQVEPHFLFNTLASVQQLAEGQSPEAAQLTAKLIAFLRAGLTGLRDETATLKQEFAMAEAYLSIMKTRIGDRLQFRLDLPLELADIAIPPAMLISLVENAIKHGIEPSTDGGMVSVTASRSENGSTVIGVVDTGACTGNVIGSRARGGMGLTNIRDRLQLLFGGAATLVTSFNEPRGFVAILSLPSHAEEVKK
jgi:Histidine kinase